MSNTRSAAAEASTVTPVLSGPTEASKIATDQALSASSLLNSPALLNSVLPNPGASSTQTSDILSSGNSSPLSLFNNNPPFSFSLPPNNLAKQQPNQFQSAGPTTPTTIQELQQQIQLQQQLQQLQQLQRFQQLYFPPTQPSLFQPPPMMHTSSPMPFQQLSSLSSPPMPMKSVSPQPSIPLQMPIKKRKQTPKRERFKKIVEFEAEYCNGDSDSGNDTDGKGETNGDEGGEGGENCINFRVQLDNASPTKRKFSKKDLSYLANTSEELKAYLASWLARNMSIETNGQSDPLYHCWRCVPPKGSNPKQITGNTAYVRIAVPRQFRAPNLPGKYQAHHIYCMILGVLPADPKKMVASRRCGHLWCVAPHHIVWESVSENFLRERSGKCLGGSYCSHGALKCFAFNNNNSIVPSNNNQEISTENISPSPLSSTTSTSNATPGL